MEFHFQVWLSGGTFSYNPRYWNVGLSNHYIFRGIDLVAICCFLCYYCWHSLVVLLLVFPFITMVLLSLVNYLRSLYTISFQFIFFQFLEIYVLCSTWGELCFCHAFRSLMQIFSFRVSLHNAGFAGSDSLLCAHLLVSSFLLVLHISLTVLQVLCLFTQRIPPQCRFSRLWFFALPPSICEFIFAGASLLFNRFAGY